MAQGQLLAIAQNQALFSLLGTQFGGNGQTTFALPDTRRRALIGADATHPVGSTQGTGTSSLTLDDIPGRTQYGDGADNTIYGGNHEDRFFGEAGHDTLIGNGGNDVLRGAAGDDVLNGGDGNDDLFGGSGIDTLIGGAGDDVYRVTNAGATVIELAGGGTDTVSSQVHGYVLPDNVDNLIALGGLMASGNALDNTIWGTDVADTPLHGLDGNDTMYGLGGGDELFGDAGIDILDGGEGDDWLHGGLGSDKLYGGNGADTLDGDNGADVLWGGNDQDVLRGGIGNDRLDGGAGADTLEGGAGNDTLIGGRARDTMTGGTNADRFLFVEGDFASRAWRDIITDFSQTQGDVIHLAGVDAIAGGPDNAFTFLGTGNFTGTAGELRYFHSSGSTNVVGDTDGDGLADFTIVLMGVVNLTAADFVL